MTVKIPTQMFSLSWNERDLYADMSELNYSGYDPLSFIYPETGECGFQLMNSNGNTIDFILNEISRNAEGEVMYWEFVPSAADLLFNRGLRGSNITIYND